MAVAIQCLCVVQEGKFTVTFTSLIVKFVFLIVLLYYAVIYRDYVASC